MGKDRPPGDALDWIAVSDRPLPVAEASSWVVVPSCGGVVTFSGTVRDHAEGRDGVRGLEYEAYEGPATERMAALAAEARRRWPGVARIALLHRVGRLALCDTAVVVAVSAPHRDEAFDAARWCIDTLKATVPIWKKEEWADGSGWGVDAAPIGDVPAGEARRERSARGLRSA
jgi:molybdopterin synthase catalytic subunit